MSLDRFKQLRISFTWNEVPVAKDPLWRIRPLINLLKASFKTFVEAGREISVDEACIPCRSSHARALIVYNPMKPLGTLSLLVISHLTLGKYHFRIYTAACATSWFVYDFKIHSKAEGDFDDHSGDASDDDVEDIDEEDSPLVSDVAEPVVIGAADDKDVGFSVLRQHVLDITKNWFGKIIILLVLNYSIYSRYQPRHQHGQLVLVCANVHGAQGQRIVQSRHCAQQSRSSTSWRDVHQEADQ